MAERSMHASVKAVHHSTTTATTTVTPAAGVDTKGFGSVEFLVSVGAITNIGNSPVPSWAFKLQESDASGSGFTDVTSETVSGSSASPAGAPNSSSGVFVTVGDAAHDDGTYRIGYVGTKRYVRCVATAADTPGATPISMVALLGHPHQAPTAD